MFTCEKNIQLKENLIPHQLHNKIVHCLCKQGRHINPCHAEYFYILPSSPVFILLTGIIPVVSIYFRSAENSEDTDQMASLESSWSGSLVFLFFLKKMNLGSAEQGLRSIGHCCGDF